ncbi:MAG TPA: AmmeMemoRadiSam system protein A [Candidatus Acidoferrales bacterium]|nr:AmmeMemoRadiSam system protein A [Candidatus Acidoferrales bacterium]
MFPLHSHEKRALLTIARKSVEFVIAGGARPEISVVFENPAAVGGAFVTLHRRGRLRGCIGCVATLESLAAVVAECAVAAATADPRFPRLKVDDLKELEIEISVLSSPHCATADEVQPGIHGVIISREGRRGILLPQVAAKYSWSREYFLEQTCYKAGLDAGAWKDLETRIEVFTAQVFSEADFPSDGRGDADAANASAYSSSQ